MKFTALHFHDGEEMIGEFALERVEADDRKPYERAITKIAETLMFVGEWGGVGIAVPMSAVRYALRQGEPVPTAGDVEHSFVQTRCSCGAYATFNGSLYVCDGCGQVPTGCFCAEPGETIHVRIAEGG